jgi:hypothetical protein
VIGVPLTVATFCAKAGIVITVSKSNNKRVGFKFIIKSYKKTKDCAPHGSARIRTLQHSPLKTARRSITGFWLS